MNKEQQLRKLGNAIQELREIALDLIYRIEEETPHLHIVKRWVLEMKDELGG